MATPTALDTLITLATKDSDAATKHLGRCVRIRDEAQQKLNMLLQYRDEYALRFQQNLTRGLNATAYRNFQLFIEKIDNVLAGQQEVVSLTQGRVDEAKTAWQACERKRLSYDTLATRAKNAAQAAAGKRDQKQSDEQASRITYYNKQN
ncbi:MAG: flagellar biosynthesis protein FliJ [Herbaspirillum sp.]|jgi:flagellar FliJ protein|nr:flagellar biosynthesis protein FliJ [Herbaspirillum sp.]